MPCVYTTPAGLCDGTAPLSANEHYLPRALGNFQGDEHLVNRICNTCQQVCSKLEDVFAHNSPEAFFREMVGRVGRKNHKGNFGMGGDGFLLRIQRHNSTDQTGANTANGAIAKNSNRPVAVLSSGRAKWQKTKSAAMVPKNPRNQNPNDFATVRPIPPSASRQSFTPASRAF